MTSFSLSIDDGLAEASPVLGRMRLDGITETTVPFAERVVLLWRRGTPSPDMSIEVLIEVLKVRHVFCAHSTVHCELCLVKRCEHDVKPTRVTERRRSAGGTLSRGGPAALGRSACQRPLRPRKWLCSSSSSSSGGEQRSTL